MIGRTRLTFLRAEGRPKDGADLRSKYNMVYLSFGKDHARASPRPALPGAPPSAAPVRGGAGSARLAVLGLRPSSVS